MDCNITYQLVPDGPYGSHGYYASGTPVAGGPAHAVARCDVHDILISDYKMPSDGLCPIGKIEAATETALQKICAAAAQKDRP